MEFKTIYNYATEIGKGQYAFNRLETSRIVRSKLFEDLGLDESNDIFIDLKEILILPSLSPNCDMGGY